MTAFNLLQIIVGELQTGRKGKLLYRDIYHRLRKKRIFAGITISRADQGIGYNNDVRKLIMESVQFNNLPVSIDVIGSEAEIRGFLPEMFDGIAHGRVLTTPVYKRIEDIPDNEPGRYVMLKIYFNEKLRWFGRQPHEQIVQLMQNYHMIWTTVHEGLQSSIQPRSLIPVVIESVGESQLVQQLIPELDKRLQECMVVVIPVQLELYR